MSGTELKSLGQIIRSGWRGLANADQADADQVVAILKEVLESLESVEEAAEAK